MHLRPLTDYERISEIPCEKQFIVLRGKSPKDAARGAGFV